MFTDFTAKREPRVRSLTSAVQAEVRFHFLSLSALKSGKNVYETTMAAVLCQVSVTPISNISQKSEIGARSMKLTYLAYTEQPDGSASLDQVSRDQWRQIVQENPALPSEKRRYFITDCFRDVGVLDCMVIETSQEEYRQ